MVSSTMKKGNQMNNLTVKNKCDEISTAAQEMWAETTDLLITLEQQDENGVDTRAFLLIEEAESCFKDARDYLDAAIDILNRTEQANA